MKSQTQNSNPASTLDRIFAFVADLLLQGVIFLLFLVIVIFIPQETRESNGTIIGQIYLILFFLIGPIYNIFHLINSGSQTPGKKGMRIHLVNHKDKTELSRIIIILRECLKSVYYMSLYFPVTTILLAILELFIIQKNKEHRSIIDQICKTQVIKLKN